MTLEGLAIGAATLVVVALVLLPVVVLVVLANRPLAGRRSRSDGRAGGLGRAAQVNAHLQAGTPHPDELGLRVPPPPGGPAPRRRRLR